MLVLLIVAAVLLPADAPAGQSSQATAAPAAQLGAGLYHSCALLDDGALPAPASSAVRCWGFSGDGQVGYGNTNVIGDDETPAAAGPVDLGAGRTAKGLAVGDFHTCAVLDNNTVRCWGYGNEGQLGYGNRNQIGNDEVPGSVGPVNLGAGRTATAITAGGNHTCAVLDNGAVRCWGLGEFGQLGNGATASIGDNEQPGDVAPVNLGAGRTATAVTAGLGHSCAVLDNGDVRCWGIGGNGQLGYGATAAVLDPGPLAPVNLGPGRTARAITAGASHTCAVLDNGSVRCWGLNDIGQLGSGNTTSVGDNEAPGSVAPVDLGPGRTAIAISSGGEHTCAVLDNGAVRCWGSGLFGQLGNMSLAPVGDNESPSSIPAADLGAGRTATAVAAGIFHTCARLDDARVRCWGNGADGRLGLCSLADIGDNETPGSVAPVDVGAGGAACPTVAAPALIPSPPSGPAAPAPPTPFPTPPAPAAPASAAQRALRAERIRAQGLKTCQSTALRAARSARARALRLYRSGTRQRAAALRSGARRAAQARTRCLSRFGRTPGGITALAARAGSSGKIVLTFRAAGSSGSSLPAARAYLIKQSLRPIGTPRAFRRAVALCRAACRFAVTQVNTLIRLEVTNLRPRTTYYYSVAARDNVSRRTGPRSTTVRARTR